MDVPRNRTLIYVMASVYTVVSSTLEKGSNGLSTQMTREYAFHARRRTGTKADSMPGCHTKNPRRLEKF